MRTYLPNSYIMLTTINRCNLFFHKRTKTNNILLYFIYIILTTHFFLPLTASTIFIISLYSFTSFICLLTAIKEKTTKSILYHINIYWFFLAGLQERHGKFFEFLLFFVRANYEYPQTREFVIL